MIFKSFKTFMIEIWNNTKKFHVLKKNFTFLKKVTYKNIEDFFKKSEKTTIIWINLLKKAFLDSNKSQSFFLKKKVTRVCYLIKSLITVCEAADNDERCIGVRLLLRLSHMTIWPEYVPPMIKFGWNLAKQHDVTQL